MYNRYLKPGETWDDMANRACQARIREQKRLVREFFDRYERSSRPQMIRELIEQRANTPRH